MKALSLTQSHRYVFAGDENAGVKTTVQSLAAVESVNHAGSAWLNPIFTMGVTVIATSIYQALYYKDYVYTQQR